MEEGLVFYLESMRSRVLEAWGHRGRNLDGYERSQQSAFTYSTFYESFEAPYD